MSTQFQVSDIPHSAVATDWSVSTDQYNGKYTDPSDGSQHAGKFSSHNPHILEKETLKVARLLIDPKCEVFEGYMWL